DFFEQVISKELEKIPQHERKHDNVKEWIFNEFILLWDMVEFFLICYEEWIELDKENTIFKR
ncbi:unnamed protein product, partial [marine sediment metagenome]